MSEAGIEKGCRLYALKRGCPSFKLQGGNAGDPDRLFLLPCNKCLLVEFKTPEGRVSPIQRVRHDQLERAGHRVVIVRSTQQFRKALDVLLQALVD